MLKFSLFCLFSTVICSDIEQGWDDLLRHEVKETYLKFIEAMSVVVDKSCLLCMSSAAATSQKHINWRMIETIFEDGDKTFIDYYKPIVEFINKDRYKGKGIPMDEVDGLCTALTEKLVLQIYSGNGQYPNDDFLKDTTPYVRSEVLKHFHKNLQFDQFSCAALSLIKNAE